MNRTILSLAIIKTHWEKHQSDYIDNFILLLATLLNEKKYQEIEIENFQIDFMDRFGLEIPINPLITIFNRATKRKILIRSGGKFYANYDKLPEHDSSIESAEIERKFNNVISAIQEFAVEKYQLETTTEEIEIAFLSFLKQHDLDILFAAKDKSILPKVESTRKLKYLISAFTIYAYDSEPNLFKFLLDVSIGHALSGAILYSEINSFSGKLKDLNIYIDTPLVFSLLGLNGYFKQKAIIELLKILREEKANLFILATTRSEVDSIFLDCYKWLEKGNYELDKSSKILRYCHRNGITATDIEGKILTLDEILGSYEIEPTVVPDYIENKQFQIDEKDLKNTIVRTYKGIIPEFNIYDYNKEATIERDVKVLSGIYRFRQGFKPKTIKDSKDLFITSNTALAFASRIFETKENGSSFTIPTCLTDVFLGTVIWLQSPQKVVSLNEKKFIADCYSATQPNELLIKRYIAEVEKLKESSKISRDEYYLLRTHRASINLLETKTMGDPEAFNGETAEEILDNIIASIKGSTSEKLDSEIDNHNQTKSELEKVSAEKDQLIVKLLNKSKRIAKSLGKFIFWIFTLFTAFALSVNLFSMYFNPNKTTKVSLWIFIGLITLFNLSTGFNIIGFRDKLIKQLEKKIYRWLNK